MSLLSESTAPVACRQKIELTWQIEHNSGSSQCKHPKKGLIPSAYKHDLPPEGKASKSKMKFLQITYLHCCKFISMLKVLLEFRGCTAHDAKAHLTGLLYWSSQWLHNPQRQEISPVSENYSLQ
jgi:hypothetical protein